jgi:hypothetical protein
MIAAVLIGLGAVLSVLSVLSLLPALLRRRTGLRLGRLSRLVPVALVVALVAAAAVSTALGSHLIGRWHAVFVLLALVAAAAGGSQVTGAVFEAIDTGDTGDRGAHGDAEDAEVGQTPEARSLQSAGQVLRGGTWIGVLERLAVYAALVARWPEGIAIVLAVKGLGRYPELRAEHRSGLAERFIIGTLVSVLWAGLCAYAATGPALG